MHKKLLMDSIYGGMCIALGAFASAGLPKPANGIVFSAGLVMIVLIQFQLFTGNILKVRDGFKLDTILKYWVLVYIGNFIGCFLSAQIIIYSGFSMDVLKSIAHMKAELPFFEAFMRGIFCNVLVCFAVYMASRIKTVSSAKIFAIMIPVTLFVISGFEHCVANMFYFSAGQVNFFNLIPVTLGNIVGGLIVLHSTIDKVEKVSAVELKISKNSVNYCDENDMNITKNYN